MSRRPPDHELVVMSRVCAMLATLSSPGRRRVLAYIGARIESLPVVDGATPAADDTDQPHMFDDDMPVPQMPAMAGSA